MAELAPQDSAYTNASPSGSSQPSASKKRKPSGQSPRTDTHFQDQIPIAPEPPRASRVPPLAFREPYENDQQYVERAPPSSKSFAARAGILPEQFSPRTNDFPDEEYTQEVTNGSKSRTSAGPEVYNKPSAVSTPDEPRRSSQSRSYDPQPLQKADRTRVYVDEEGPKLAQPSSKVPSSRRSSQPQTYSNGISPREVEKSSTTAGPAISHQRSTSNSGQRSSNARNSVSSQADTNLTPTRAHSKRYSTSQPFQAADKSPLQQLELKLSDISKEEKRVKVQLAEQKLREREEALREREEAIARRASQAASIPERQSSTKRGSHGATAEKDIPSSPRNASNRQSSTREVVGAINDLPKSQPQIPATVVPRSAKSMPASSQPTTRRASGEGVRFHHQVEDMESTPRRSIPGTAAASALAKTRREVGSGSSIDKTELQDPEPGNAYSHEITSSGARWQGMPSTNGSAETAQVAQPENRHEHLTSYFHRKPKEESSTLPQAGNLSEWRDGGIAMLTLADMKGSPHAEPSPTEEEYRAWWEKSESADKRKHKSQAVEEDDLDGYVDDSSSATAFDPPLYLKCGPLLRYCGMRTEETTRKNHPEREIWRGSVMIVTEDKTSTYTSPPTLRLFHQQMKLLPPPPKQFDESAGEGLESEYVDPVGGLPKLTRTGGTVYVKPVEDLDIGKDVSRIEDDDGLYEEMRTANVPTSYGKADELLGRSPHPTRSSHAQHTARQEGRYREVKGIRLHAERGVTFWRFKLEVELGAHQQRIAYRINRGASVGFWVPARGKSMNIMFHSCNGFSASVDPDHFSGPDPLWRDVLNAHQTKPFHVMIGGGDQIYNDAVVRETSLFRDWLDIKNPHHKHQAPFTAEMMNELEDFYLKRYSMWFSQGLFGMANSQIPMVNIWDDHDIIDGFGSYPHDFMKTPVFSGIGNIAFKYYMLFQHQSVVEEVTADEPSWLLGTTPGPYIHAHSRSLFMSLGKKVAFLGLDCRTERMRDEVLSEATYDAVFDRCHQEIIKGETKHLIVLLGVPIAYPRLVWLENVLTSRVLDPVKALGRAGLLGNFMNKFDGGVEILDDLDDHWTAKNHKDERNWFIEELQELAAEKSVRITILGGDVHLAAIGQFYSTKSLNIPKDEDFRYMPNVISSAIVNTPPPDMMADVLNKRNKIHHLNAETDEDMIPMFTHNVDGKPRNNKHLLPSRNWCSITEYFPGSTPAPTPPSTSPTESQASLPVKSPGILQRTLSLGRNDSRPGSSLIRRLSLTNKTPASADDVSQSHAGFPSPYASAPTTPMYDTAPIATRPISHFHRRPTNLSEKAAKKGAATDDHIDLEFGLDICLNCEITQGDPSGSTEQYRILVPALMYDGPLPEHKKRKDGILKRLGSRKRGSAAAPIAAAGLDNNSRDSWQSAGHQSRDDYSLNNHEGGPPVQAGLFRRLSNRLSRSSSQNRASTGPNVLQKRRVSLDALPQSRALEPFKPRPTSQDNNPRIHQQHLPAEQQSPSQNTQSHSLATATNAYTVTSNTPRDPPTSFSQKPYNPLQTHTAYQRYPEESTPHGDYIATSRTRASQAATQAPPASQNRTVRAYSFESDISHADQDESGSSTPSSHNQDTRYPSQPAHAYQPTNNLTHRDAIKPSGRGSGAAKFFGEDLPSSPTAANNTNNASHRNSHGGYSGIEAYGSHNDDADSGQRKKGWRRFLP